MNPSVELENVLVEKLKEGPPEFKEIRVCGYHAGEIAEIPRCVVGVTSYELDGTLGKEKIYTANVTCSLVFASDKLRNYLEVFSHIDKTLYFWQGINSLGIKVFGGYLDSSETRDIDDKYLERVTEAKYFVKLQ